MRIIIVGNGGTGKSVLGHTMSNDLNIPVTHLDILAWTKNFERVPEEIFRERLYQAMNQEHMIIEGWANHATMKERLIWADVIIYLKFPLDFCLKSVEQRNIEYDNKKYPYDNFEGSKLAHAALYVEAVTRVHVQYEPELQLWINEIAHQKKIYIFTSREELTAAYKNLLNEIVALRKHISDF
jgi:adenylate kinase family enzyme